MDATRFNIFDVVEDIYIRIMSGRYALYFMCSRNRVIAVFVNWRRGGSIGYEHRLFYEPLSEMM